MDWLQWTCHWNLNIILDQLVKKIPLPIEYHHPQLITKRTHPSTVLWDIGIAFLNRLFMLRPLNPSGLTSQHKLIELHLFLSVLSALSAPSVPDHSALCTTSTLTPSMVQSLQLYEVGSSHWRRRRRRDWSLCHRAMDQAPPPTSTTQSSSSKIWYIYNGTPKLLLKHPSPTLGR